MRKGSGVAYIVGIAMVLIASTGVAVTASELAESASQRQTSQLSLMHKVRAIEPSSSVVYRDQFQHTSYQRSAEAGEGIRSTSRISIPYGITTPLMLHNMGQSILVAGHGGCTEDQEVTVQVTLTQTSTAALATGQTQDVCTGVLQSWSSTAVATTDVLFVAEPAQACGVAETWEGEAVTDRFEWCRDVDLVYGLYLPLALQN